MGITLSETFLAKARTIGRAVDLSMKFNWGEKHFAVEITDVLRNGSLQCNVFKHFSKRLLPLQPDRLLVQSESRIFPQGLLFAVTG